MARSDPELRALDRALDPEVVLDFLIRAVGLDAEAATRLECVPEVVAHKPGQRCAIRYALARSPGSRAQGGALPPVFGKLYRSRRQATRMFERMEALGRGLPAIPECLLLALPLRMVLQECVEGVDLGQLLETPRVERPLVQAAQWLARLHGLPPLSGLREIPLSRSLEKTTLWSEEIRACLASQAQDLRHAQDALAALARHLPAHRPAMMHRDFSHAHVLWNGERIWIVDFDELSIGDPALDVGHFLAHLEYEAHRRSGGTGAFAALAGRFLRAYREEAHVDPQPRLSFHRAYTFLKLAHQQATGQRGDWQREVQVLVDLVRREGRGAETS